MRGLPREEREGEEDDDTEVTGAGFPVHSGVGHERETARHEDELPPRAGVEGPAGEADRSDREHE